MSLRRRVLSGCIAVALVLLAADAAIVATFRGFLLDRVDDQLTSVAERLAGDARIPLRAPGTLGRRLPAAPDDAGVQVLSDLFIGVLGERDTLVARSGASLRDVPPPLLDAAALRGQAESGATPSTVRAESGGGSWRVVAVSRARRNVLVVGSSLADVEATLRRVLLVVGIASAAVLTALGLVAAWVLRLGVKPLTAMAETAGAIAAGDLSRRVEPAGGPTEAGRLGSALNRMLAQIEEAFRIRGESEERLRRFVADASHELRTPLTSIRGYAELFRRGGLQSPGELADAMRRMEEEARRMGALVDDLLVLARLDEGRPIERAPVRLDLLTADAVRDAQAVEPGRPVDLESEPVAVPGDEQRLRQVLGNLLANARVHTPAGTPVHVTVRPAGGVARLEVADEGPGMAPDVARRVFERFFRSDASRTRAGGATGLGLSIVKALAEAHGGRVHVETAPGAGARFVVELPLTSVGEAAPAGGSQCLDQQPLPRSGGVS